MDHDRDRERAHAPARSPHDTAAGTPGKRALTEDLAPETTREGWAIELDRPAAVLGEPARFKVPAAERWIRPNERYACTWYIHFDPAAALPVFRANPTQTSQSSFAFTFEHPGTHTVACEAVWQGSQRPPPGEPSYRLEKTVTIRRLEDISRDALGEYERRRDEHQVRRTIADHVDPRAGAQGREHDQHAAALHSTLLAPVELRAVLSDRSTGESVPLSLVIGRSDLVIPNPRGPAIHREVVKLLDLTRGARRAEYAGPTAKAAIDDLRSGNAYPRGVLELEIPPNDAGISPLHDRFATTGASSVAEWAHALGLVSLGLSAVATVLTGGLAAPLFVLATGAAAASGVLTTIDDLQATKVDGATIAIDVIQLTASILPFVNGAMRLARGATGAQALAGMTGRWVQIGQVALDGGTAIWIEVEAYRRLLDELASPELAGPERKAERDKKIILFVANLVKDASIIGVSARGTRRGQLDDPRLFDKVNRETARHLASRAPGDVVHVEWTEWGVIRRGDMTIAELRLKLQQPDVTHADIDAVIGKGGGPTRVVPDDQPTWTEQQRRMHADLMSDELGAAARDRLARMRREAEDRLASGRPWLAELAANGGQLAVRRGEVTVQLVQDLTLVTNREIGLFRMMKGDAIGDRVLTIGTTTQARIPDGPVRRCILHSHPSGGLVFSEGDVRTLIEYGKDGHGQWSSIIVTPHIEGLGADAKRFDIDAERRRWRDSGAPWAERENPDRKR